jgi:hypothetical protein
LDPNSITADPNGLARKACRKKTTIQNRTFALRNIINNKTSSTMAEMRALTQYFAQFDGSDKSWEDVEPYYAACFDKDVSIVTVTKDGEGSTGYEGWADFLKVSLERKADIQMTYFEKVDAGIIYAASLVYPGRDPITFRSLSEFKDGKIVKIGPPPKK